MEVYRITLEKYSNELKASGLPNRWNSRHTQVIYTSCTRAMAALENIVHRSGEGLQERFRLIVIQVPDSSVEALSVKLHGGDEWFLRKYLAQTQKIGDEWVKKSEKLGLMIPSAIVPGEQNLILNPLHQDFKKVKVLSVEPFLFDPRIKS